MRVGFRVGSSTDVLGGLIPIDSELFRGFTLLALVPWLAVYFAIDVVRQKRFHTVEIPKVYALVHSDGHGGKV